MTAEPVQTDGETSTFLDRVINTEIVEKISKDTVIFDVRKIFQKAYQENVQVITPQEAEEPGALSTELCESLNTALSAKQWCCTMLADHKKWDILEEYLEKIN